VTPIAVAAVQAFSICVKAEEVQLFSGPPQLMEITDGLLVASLAAVVMASTKPCSVLGPK